MAPITEAEVLAILQPGTDPISLAPFVATATLLVTEDLAAKGLTDERLHLIGVYLAAHFATITVGELTMRKVGDATDDYVKVRLYDGLRASTFGQQAIALDPSGTLANFNGYNAEFDLVSRPT